MLEFQNVSIYRENKKVLDNLNMQVEEQPVADSSLTPEGYYWKMNPSIRKRQKHICVLDICRSNMVFMTC